MTNNDRDFRMKICTLPEKLVAHKLRLGGESLMGETGFVWPTQISMIYRDEKRLNYKRRPDIPPFSFASLEIYVQDWRTYSLDQFSREKDFCQTQDKVLLKSVSETRTVI